MENHSLKKTEAL